MKLLKVLLASAGTVARAEKYGTANYHNFKRQFDTTITTFTTENDLKICTDDSSPAQSKCPADRDCCEAQYSPSGFGCTNESGDGCCLLGPALSPAEINPELPNCLIMGDSVSIGYVIPVALALAPVCNVQHAPWDVSNGGWGSSDAARGCLDLMLRTAKQEEVKWDVIFFNNGLHDLDNNNTQGIQTYTDNMNAITAVLKESTDNLLYGMTTPQQALYRDGNSMVEDLNAAAQEIMASHGVPTFDLYQRVVDYCGPVPYVDCDICAASPCDFHYTYPGSAWIGTIIEQAILSVLPPKATE